MRLSWMWPLGKLESGISTLAVVLLNVLLVCTLINVEKLTMRDDLVSILLVVAILFLVYTLLVLATLVGPKVWRLVLVVPSLLLVPTLMLVTVAFGLEDGVLLNVVNVYTVVYFGLLNTYLFLLVLIFALDTLLDMRKSNVVSDQDVEKGDEEVNSSLIDPAITCHEDDTFTAIAQRDVKEMEGPVDNPYTYCLPVDSCPKHGSSSMLAGLASSQFPQPCEVIAIDSKAEKDEKKSFDDDFVVSMEKEKTHGIRERRTKSHSGLLEIDGGDFSPFKSRAESSQGLPTKIHIFLPNNDSSCSSSSDSDEGHDEDKSSQRAQDPATTST